MACFRWDDRHVTNQADQIQQVITQTIRTELGARIRAELGNTIRVELGDLRTFIDRRIAELSAEVHATSDLLDFSENNLSGQLKGIKEQIAGLIAMPAAATHNSGLELEAVVQATEAAANRIMEAAEAIGDWLRDSRADPAAMQVVNEKVNAIFEACSFQDLTSQRIRRAIQSLQQVEHMLTDMAPGIAADPAPAAGESADLAQDAVDSLFGESDGSVLPAA
jgi:chemotaxis protein CheZ